MSETGKRRWKGRLGAAWGLLGVAWLIVWALARLVPRGLEALSHPLDWSHWGALAVWLPAMAWGEGYRGFHLAFSPMVAARARYLRDHPRTLHVVLAPVYCFGLLHATRRRKFRSTMLSVGIIAIVVLVNRLAQPWRGILDLGVVLGLTVGLGSMAYFAARALRATAFDHPPEVPAPPADLGD